MSDRTVYDVAWDAQGSTFRTDPTSILMDLGVDPGMPFEQFTRWLRYGQRADEMKTVHESGRGTANEYVAFRDGLYLDAASIVHTIKGDQP